MLSVVIPALDEGPGLDALVAWLLREPGIGEVVVVEAGVVGEQADLRSACRSADACPRLFWIPASRNGRAAQMNQGADRCKCSGICFLHADSRPPAGFAAMIENALDTTSWGRFDIRLDHPALRYRVIESMINLRSRATCLGTGDQGIFVQREFFRKLGGFADIALMEDIEFSKRAARHARPALIRNRLVTSVRRWQKFGTAKTILLMWKLRFMYWRGTDPGILAKMYRDAR